MPNLSLSFYSNRVRKVFIFLFHILAIVIAFLDAFALRFDLSIPSAAWPLILALLPAVIVIKLGVFWLLGLTGGWWRYVSIPDLMQIFKANVVASVAVVLYLVFFQGLEGLPRSVVILDFLLCFSIMIGVRVITRIARERFALYSKGYHAQTKSVLIVGSGVVAQSIVREIRENPKLDKAVLGYVDNDLRRQGKVFYGVPVMGTLDDMEKICLRNEVDLVIIAQSSVSPRELREIVTFCRRQQITSKILPALGDIIDGQVTLEQCRPIQLEDLLGRPPIRLDVDEIRAYLHGRCILVTGAAGSIGSEICRQVAAFDPSHLILFENAETPLFHLENELREKFPHLSLHASLSDIRDGARVAQVFSRYGPQVVFHAAAYKHVPMSEVNPTNIMGATKRIAELYVQNLPRQAGTKAVTVRFGNVLGSHGSVIPTFREQIIRGGPVTVTHPEITRFFMTIPEAVQLVLQAGCMGHGGEIFLLDMGDPVKIVCLAEEMIRLSGHKPYDEIEIVFTGLRPGEKLYEELLISGEGVKATRHEKIRILEAASFSSEWLDDETRLLLEATRGIDISRVVALLKELVPEYQNSAAAGNQAGPFEKLSLVGEPGSVGNQPPDHTGH